LRDLVMRHADRTYLLSLRILCDHDIARALVDRLFAEVWESDGRCLGQGGDLRAWLRRRIVVSGRARQGVAPARPEGDEPLGRDEPGCYSGAALDRAMARLAWPERVAIILA